MEANDLYTKAAELPLAFTETVTFQVRQATSPPTFISYTLTRVLRHPVADMEVILAHDPGLLSVTMTRWTLPQASLDNAILQSTGQVTPITIPPKPDDQVIDQSNTTYIINSDGVKSLIYNGAFIEHICLTSRAIS